MYLLAPMIFKKKPLPFQKGEVFYLISKCKFAVFIFYFPQVSGDSRHLFRLST